MNETLQSAVQPPAASDQPAVEGATDLRSAFARQTFANAIENAKVACGLVFLLMPLGWLMDRFVYPIWSDYFLILRLMSSMMAALVYVLLRQSGWTKVQYRVLSAGWWLVPSFFICWMIYVTEGLASSYYAGLNLVILAVSSVIQATLLESLAAVSVILLMYLAVCLPYAAAAEWRFVANNSFFIFCTSAIVVTGNYFFNRLRFREFALRFELDKNRHALEESNRKLMELDQAKSRFFANISHELRTPLTLLLAPLETMLNRFRTSLDQETRNLLVTMHSNGMRLLKLINDLLDLVRLESGRMEVRKDTVSMSEFIRGLVSATQQVAQDKHIRVETFIDPQLGPVVLDRDKLEKIVLNLVFNALKFTPAGGRVDLCVEKQSEQIAIVVKDTGMGISEKNLAHMFERFWQADDSSRRKYQGMGIGLALVK
jgi:signal transduction histidine kinase